MGVIPKDLATHTSKFLKGEQFDGEGMKLRVKGFGVVVANDPEYGAKLNADGSMPHLIESGKLKVGETFKYEFETVEDEPQERVFESTSPGFFIAFSQLNPDADEVIHVRREGKTSKTRYFINKA